MKITKTMLTKLIQESVKKILEDDQAFLAATTRNPGAPGNAPQKASLLNAPTRRPGEDPGKQPLVAIAKELEVLLAKIRKLL